MGAMPMTVRRARVDELEALCALEVEADGAFALVGLAGVLSAPPPHVEAFRAAAESSRLFVATDTRERVVGFVRLALLDGHAHVEQLSVHPAYAGHGIGAELLTVAAGWALGRGGDRLTLTTFRNVPWNGPYYERLGWVVLPAGQLGPDLAATRANAGSGSTSLHGRPW
ncbi:MAG: GNAT family N-acetyltransferase [Humibacillus sp.]|nr:GNAT family N-acetyltransferase [Humibacillus sp.]MDN5777463.1 GNAT family N-acetyltransferase [Humibacillus sp.]